MKKLLPLLTLPAFVGCLTASTPAPVAQWPLEYTGSGSSQKAARFGVARVSQIAVRAPYAATSMVVLRADGTVAFDPYNEFAALPPTLLKGVVFDALERSGLFSLVVNASSSVQSSVSVEAYVTRLALDCRESGSRRAVADVVVRVLNGRDDLQVLKGTGGEDAADGNFGRAFSGAVSAALASALAQLK